MSTKLSQSNDPRVKRTRQWIRQALLELIEEKGFDQVTVQEIAERAGVNRVTFYKHYEDKWNLLTSWVHETRQFLDENAFSLYDPRAQKISSGFIPEVIIQIFVHIQEHLPFYSLMVGRNPLPLIANELEKQIEDFSRQHLLELEYAHKDIDIPLELLCREYAAGFVGIVRWWIEHDCQYSPMQMGQWVWRSMDDIPETKSVD